MNKDNKSIRLGDEFDNVLMAALMAVLKSREAVEMENSWGVGGSQELYFARTRLDGAVINIESETYIGLTIHGPGPIVESLAREVTERLRTGDLLPTADEGSVNK
ncbi:hypothetical protein JRG42_21540 [Pseudomonas granadensis]|uniref:Uncharacterized protein n=1 Tax=Pseudomonas granadensis TaxID=1421430 RepID=A0ABX7GCS8_9PSED|nr:hypothetical protein [Pseudomonas granadensis]MBN6775685.1 hypothetical protein [Pseudomonas granadensis]MBN6807021.1 hypothetical protein [Pseudomonas granadensis]MBN6833711.1 hypothetical protein [Pseudomonas granadensis]MBN6841267.1 hypothetical protein [Pseudomonas granadensis]MBN6869899.1 hypothetical protein [Pseudomonas granadensis]